MSQPAIDILQPDNIVLPHIVADLYLDEHQHCRLEILQPMHRPERQIDGFALGQNQPLLIARHLRDPLHHDPMFRPMRMFL